MTSTSTKDVALEFVDELLRHDWESAWSMLSETATVFISGRNVLAGAFTSPAHYRQTQTWIFREHDAGIDVTGCSALLIEGETAVALVEERAHRAHRMIEYRRIYVLTIRAGQIVEWRIVDEDPYALDDFWE